MRHAHGIRELGLPAAVIAAMFAVVVFCGAVPFVAVPTTAQAVWMTGFSESLARGPWFGVHAHHFGYPQPSSLPFGLPAAYPAAFLIRAGLHAPDAYAAVAAFWLATGFLGAWRFALLLGVKRYSGMFAATFWMTLPIVWLHAVYSAVSFGIALLPFYFWSVCRVYLRPNENWRAAAGPSLLYAVVPTIALFMDGYTFVMFAVGSSLIGVYLFFRTSSLRRHLWRFVLPLHAIAFSGAYVLYTLYIGKPQYAAAPMDFFRGWGADVTFFLAPSRGFWLWDLLHLGVERSYALFFGGAMTWLSTFTLPLLIAGLVSWIWLRKKQPIATGFLLLALFGLYMSLGPSLKINSTRPADFKDASGLMPARLAVAGTGNAWLSGHVPGFRNMRASYRWAALGMVGLWALLALMLARLESDGKALFGICLVAALVVGNLPHWTLAWRSYRANRAMLVQIDTDLVADMRSVVHPGEKVAFLPYGNDFLANYLAPRLDIVTFNVGGDKQLAEAARHWPSMIRSFPMGQVDERFADRVLLLLAARRADSVILPYFSMLWAAHRWPDALPYKAALAPVLKKLQDSGLAQVVSRPYYAAVSLSFAALEKAQAGLLWPEAIRKSCVVPFCLARNEFVPGRTLSQVGRTQDGKLYSDNRGGFLLFGPYVHMNPGVYQFTITGTAQAGNRSWADVFSGSGGIRAGVYPLVPQKGAAGGVLVNRKVALKSPTDDLEVRVYVGPDDEVRVDSYELAPEPIQEGN